MPKYVVKIVHFSDATEQGPLVKIAKLGTIIVTKISQTRPLAMSLFRLITVEKEVLCSYKRPNKWVSAKQTKPKDIHIALQQ